MAVCFYVCVCVCVFVIESVHCLKSASMYARVCVSVCTFMCADFE